jgi:glycerophosphoryl diester phosphodiesterase
MDPVGYAHRGFAPDGAENSMAAFAAAVALGYRFLETDARATADGIALAFHDDRLDRVTNHTGRLRDLSWREVGQARIQGREPIPLLADVLGGFGEVSVNIDVKSDDAIAPTLAAIERTNSWHRVRLAAFSHRRLHRLRQAAGAAVASALSPIEIAALKSGRRPRLPAADYAAQVPARLGSLAVITPAFVRTAHAHGIAVHAWTVNDRNEMSRLLAVGVDAIITDRADELRDVLIGRGQWPG